MKKVMKKTIQSLAEVRNLFASDAVLPVECCDIPMFNEAGLTIYLIRADKFHPIKGSAISGNKLFKLLPNIQQAIHSGLNRLVSFGGVWSNHLYSLAAAGKHWGMETVGIVRGERALVLTPTLYDAQKMGMHLQFVPRKLYREFQQDIVSDTSNYVDSMIESRFGKGVYLPAGGSNVDGLLGTIRLGELIREVLPQSVDSLWLPTATGGTLAGISAAFSSPLESENVKCQSSRIMATVVLNNDNVACEIEQLLKHGQQKQIANYDVQTAMQQIEFIKDRNNGYAKVSSDYKAFYFRLEDQLNASIDHVYMGKVFYSLWGALQNGELQGQKTVAILHTGGQQGRRGLDYSA